MLTLRWRRRCANVTLLRCWLCIAETLAKRWCQRWHCSDVDDAPPVKFIVLSGAGLSNSGASPAAPWAQSLMTKRYELWNIFIYFPHQENVSDGWIEGELNSLLHLLKHQSFFQCWLICKWCFMSEVKSSLNIGFCLLLVLSCQSREYRPTLVVDCCP